MTELTSLPTFPLASLDSKALKKIEDGMLEHSRAIKAFGRNNSQTTSKLMSLTMLSEGPYRRLRQCLAEIDKRRHALNEAAFRLEKQKIKRRRLENYEPSDSFDADLLAVKKMKLEYDITETQRMCEGSLKDIAALQDAYEQIRNSHNIPANWDETHFEGAEVRSHLLSAFRLAFFDILERGVLSQAASEYLMQFGIHPFTAQTVCQDYLAECEAMKGREQLPTIEHYFTWLDGCADSFGESYKAAMARLGISSLVTEWCQFRQTLND